MLRSLAFDKPKQGDSMLSQDGFAYNSMVNHSTSLQHFAIVYTKVPNSITDLISIPIPHHQGIVTFVENYAQFHKKV